MNGAPWVIIVGYDGSDRAVSAIADLPRAGLPEAGSAVVVSVADSSILPAGVVTPVGASVGEFTWVTPLDWQQLADEAVAEAGQRAHSGAELLRKALPGWDVTTEHGIDSPYWALIDSAEKHRANLIVVGSHGRSQLGRWFLGSISQYVLAHAGCSVRVGRRIEPTAGSPRRLLVGIDGSAGAEAAVDEVCRRRWPSDTEVCLLMSVDLGLAAALRSREREAEARPALKPKQILAAATELHERSGLKATPILEQGDAKRVIVEQAERWGADTIFLGATGHGRLHRIVLGSVAAAVAARAHCSVEVIRTPPDGATLPR